MKRGSVSTSAWPPLGCTLNKLALGSCVFGVPITMRSGEPPAALTATLPPTVPCPLTASMALALPVLARWAPLDWACAALLPDTPPGPCSGPTPPPLTAPCAPCTPRLASTDPSCTLGAARPWLRLLRVPTSMCSVPPLVIEPPIWPICTEIDGLLHCRVVPLYACDTLLKLSVRYSVCARLVTLAAPVMPSMLRSPPAAMRA